MQVDESHKPHWFTVPEGFDPQLPTRYRDAADEARHLVDTVSRKLIYRDIDENGFAHLHCKVLDDAIRHRTRAPIIRALSGRCLYTSPHRAGYYSRGYRLTDEMLAREPERLRCRDQALIHKICRVHAWLASVQRSRWLPIHEALSGIQRCLAVGDAADSILESLEPKARFCQRVLLNNIRGRRLTFSVSKWGRCFNSFCGIKRELRPAIFIDKQPMASLDIRCAQPALLALLIGTTSPSFGLSERTTYRVTLAVRSILPLAPCEELRVREFGDFRELVCGGGFNEWLQSASGLSRDEAKRRFLIDVLAKRGR